MLSIADIYIYPIKSLGGVALESSQVTDRGLEHDRRWMLVDDNLRFLTQREHPEMALLQVSVEASGLKVHHKLNSEQLIDIPFNELQVQSSIAIIWDDACRIQFYNAQIDEWFSEMLSIRCRLAYMPDSSHRRVEEEFARNDEITSLSDGYPFTIISQASLDELNGRLQEPIPMNRFRPNFVIAGGYAFQEDHLEHFTINNIHFYGVKPCSRCNITTINQSNAALSKEPLKTLTTYRSSDNKVYFGQNLLHRGTGVLHKGDIISY